MRRTAALLFALAMLAVPGTTYAQDPVGNAYGGDNEVLNEVSGGGGSGLAPTSSGGDDDGTPARRVTGASPPASTGGSLPFTGLDVGLLLAGGLAMLGVGIGLRRISRSGT